MSSEPDQPVMPTGTGDYVSRVEAVIDRPAKDIWPHLLNTAAWMPAVVMQTVAGEPSQIGETKRLVFKAMGEDSEPFFFKTVFLLPEQQFIYRAYTEGYLVGDGYGGYRCDGFEMLTLIGQGESTKVVFNAMLVNESLTLSSEELQASNNDSLVEAEGMWKTNLQCLKELVENA